MARASRVQSRVTAARILATARDQFAASGYAATGLDAIAAASGVTRGAVYNHFGSKRGLFVAVVDAMHEDVGAAVLTAADRHDDAWSGFLAGCRAFLSASLDPSVRRIMLIDAPAVIGWDTWRTGDASNSGRLLDEALHDLADAGLVPRDLVAEAGALLSGAMNSAALLIAESTQPDQALERSWAVLDRLIRALRTD